MVRVRLRRREQVVNDHRRVLRVYRLIVALSGRPMEAERVLWQLPAVIPDGPRGERIAVQAAREIAPAQLSLFGTRLSSSLAGLERSQREVWVLRDGLGLSERNTAIAMDCSRTVVRQRLQAIEGQFDQSDEVRFRQAIAKIGLPPEYCRAKRDAVGVKRLLWGLGVVAVVLLVLEGVRRFGDV